MAVRTVSNTGGNWNATAAWTGGVVPIAGDTVNFTATSGNLVINVLTAVLGGIDFSNYIGTITFNNSITSNGVINLGTGGYTQAGTEGLFIGNSGTATLSGTTVWSRKLQFQGTNVTTTLSNNITTTGAIILNATTSNVINGNTLNIGGNLTVISTGTISGTTSIVFNGTGTWSHTAAGIIQNNITINTAGTLTIGTNIYYNTGTLTYTAGTVTTTGSTLNISAATTINTGGMGTTTNAWNNVILTVAATFIIALSSNLNTTGTLTITSTTSAQTLSFSGVGLLNPSGSLALNLNSTNSATFTITIPNTLTVANLIFNCGTNNLGVITLNGNSINITGNLSQTNATFIVVLAGTTSLNLTGTGTWSTVNTAGSGIRNSMTINTAGTITITGTIYYNTGTLTYTTGTVTTTGSTLFVGLNTTLATGTLNWNNIIFAGVSTITITTNLNILGNLTTQTNAVTINGLFNINVSGNLAINTTTSGTSTIRLIGTGTWSHSTIVYLSNSLTIVTAGTITVSGNIYYATGILTHTSGTVITTGSTLNILNTTTLNTGGVTWNNVTITAGTTTTITLSSNLNVPGTLSFVSTGNGFILSFSGAGTLNPSGPLSLTVNSVTGATFTINIPTTLTITNLTSVSGINNAGIITLNGNSINITGNLSFPGSFTLTLGGTTSLNLTGTGTWSSSLNIITVQNNLTINTAGTITISGNVYYNTRILTYTAGTVTTTGSTLNISAATTINTNTLNWNNVTIGNGTSTLTSNLNILGNLATTAVATVINGLFNINVGGNLTINTTLGGTATIVLNGTGTWSHGAAFYLSNPLIFNTSGTITISGTVYFSSVGSIIYTSGTVISNGSTLQTNAGTISTGTMLWNNILFATNGSSVMSIGSNLYVNGTFTIGGNGTVSGAFNIYCNNFTINNSTSGGSVVAATMSQIVYVYNTLTFGFSSSGTGSNGATFYVNGNLALGNGGGNGGTSQVIMTGTGTITGTNGFNHPLTINSSGVITFSTTFTISSTFTYTSGIVKANTTTLTCAPASGQTLIGMNKIAWKAVVLTSGQTFTMNEFFSGSPSVRTNITPSSTTNYIITFQNRFEKFSKFVKVNRATISTPGQLTVTTYKGNQLNNVGIKFAPNNINNGLAKNNPSVQPTPTYGLQPTFLMADPTLS